MTCYDRCFLRLWTYKSWPYHSKSCKPPAKTKKTKKIKKIKKTKVRVATWNLGTLNQRSAEVMEPHSRWRVDIYVAQKHGYMASLTPNQFRILMGKDCKFKFFCPQASILLTGNWADKIVEIQHIPDRIIRLKLIIGKALFSLSGADKERFYTSCNMLLPRSQPQRYSFQLLMEQSRWCHCCWVQRCSWWAWLQCP